MTADEPVEGRALDVLGLTCPRCEHPRLAHWTPGKHTTACVVCLEGQIRTADLNDVTRVGFCCIPAEQITPRPSPSVPVESREQPRDWYGFAAMFAKDHQPEPGGCTCGFCAWSVEHVAVSLAIELQRERDATISELRAEAGAANNENRRLRQQWENRSPTQWAYDQACRVMHEAKAERDRARDLAAHLEDEVAKVAELHVKFDGGGDRSNRCAHDGFKWPCATARALAAHLEAEQAEED